jgi:hypothetical protein
MAGEAAGGTPLAGCCGAAPVGRPWDGLPSNAELRKKTAKPASPKARTAVRTPTNADLRAVDGASGGE